MDLLHWALAALAALGLVGTAVFCCLWRQECCRTASTKVEFREYRRPLYGADLGVVQVLEAQLQSIVVAGAYLMKRVPYFEKFPAKRRAFAALLLGMWLQGLGTRRMAALLDTSLSTTDRYLRYLMEAGMLPPSVDADAIRARFNSVPPAEAGGDTELCVKDLSLLGDGGMKTEFLERLSRGQGGDTMADS